MQFSSKTSLTLAFLLVFLLIFYLCAPLFHLDSYYVFFLKVFLLTFNIIFFLISVSFPYILGYLFDLTFPVTVLSYFKHLVSCFWSCMENSCGWRSLVDASTGLQRVIRDLAAKHSTVSRACLLQKAIQMESRS